MSYDAKFESILRRHLRYLPSEGMLEPDSSLHGLGLDSMRSVELLFDLEDSYEVTLPDEALTAETFATPRSLYAVVAIAVGA
ncbi:MULTISPECIES: acyl carrier protein [Amycolatopsis]|uniref:Carrier domain-containing protein n=1 Tax=Amycolatopsis bullii TaxID=941987 RepID=A0ABQ3KFM3_9PSEU|nr:phosphopantetheine-binding protein [Amycolatopsis bullii]GHG14343.1 hypothetical protein GCM10017567_35150 [Amycolatopsis bullii]